MITGASLDQDGRAKGHLHNHELEVIYKLIM